MIGEDEQISDPSKALPVLYPEDTVPETYSKESNVKQLSSDLRQLQSDSELVQDDDIDDLEEREESDSAL